MNTAHNAEAGQQDWMLQALDTLAGEVADGAFLRRCRDTVASRYECFGALAYPTTRTWEAAWSALRQSMRAAEYWFSIEEVQFMGACCGVGVDVYVADVDFAGAADFTRAGSRSLSASRTLRRGCRLS